MQRCVKLNFAWRTCRAFLIIFCSLFLLRVLLGSVLVLLEQIMEQWLDYLEWEIAWCYFWCFRFYWWVFGCLSDVWEAEKILLDWVFFLYDVTGNFLVCVATTRKVAISIELWTHYGMLHKFLYFIKLHHIPKHILFFKLMGKIGLVEKVLKKRQNVKQITSSDAKS